MARKGYTLVALIGTGQYDKSEKAGYLKTCYYFEDKKPLTYSIFSDALIEYYQNELKKVIIIGTVTSSWNALLVDPNGTDYDKWVDIEAEINSDDGEKGIKEETFDDLEEYLTESYENKYNKHIEFKLLTHSADFNSDIDSIYGVYAKIHEYIAEDTKLIIDITHGFRYMPMIMYQTIQLYGREFALDDVKILYGELNKDKSVKDESGKYIPVGYARDISNVWKMAEIEKQVYAFKSTFDGIRLGETLKLYKEDKLAEWIMGFSDSVKKNYIVQIRQAIRELRTLVEDNGRNKEHRFIDDLCTFLKKELVKPFDSCKSLSEYMLIFSRILYNHELSTQAMIALRECIDTRIKEKYFPDKIGIYIKNIEGDLITSDKMYGETKRGYTDFSNWDRYNLDKLREKRNMIAHAGNVDLYKNKKTEEKNIPMTNAKTAYKPITKDEFEVYYRKTEMALEKLPL